MVPCEALLPCAKVSVSIQCPLRRASQGILGVEVEAEDVRASGGSVLVVCTGNVCRSPYIERRLAQLIDGVGVSLESAGTGALEGEPIDPGSVAELRERGASAGDFAGRQLTSQMIAHADLVLTAARSHRAEVARLLPRSMAYCFTLGDFADLVADLDSKLLSDIGTREQVAPWAAQVASLAAARRGSIPPRPREESDIPDPYRQGRAAFTRMAREVERVLPAVAAVLAAAPRQVGSRW